MPSFIPNHLVIPVETLNREFDAKLMLALTACGRGWRSIIGSRTKLHDRINRLPPSIYFSKGVRIGNRAAFRLLTHFGHVIVAQDEESLIRPPDEVLHMMLDRETFSYPRLLFAWGSSNADSWRAFSGYPGTPIVESGNPRVDMLRPELRNYYAGEVEKIRSAHGDFVLFSSNFSLVNHFIPNHVRFRVARHADKEEADETRDELVAHKAKLFAAFQEMLPRLAEEIRPLSLIVRPHPSENHETWTELLGGIDNVRVIHEGAIAPWLIAARALVHNSCTSAIEASLLGTPAFSFRPMVSERYDHELPNALSECISDAGDFLSAVAAAARSSDKAPLSGERKRTLERHIAAFEGALSCERIVDALEAERGRLAVDDAAKRPVKGRYKHYKRLLQRRIKAASRHNKSSRRYSEHKFAGITEGDIVAKVAALRAVRPDLPAVGIRRFADSIFVLEALAEKPQS